MDKPGTWEVDSEIHWKCPDCMLPCGCTDEIARQAPHVRCGAFTE